MSINPDRIIAARKKIAEDLYDTDSWLLLLKHAQCRSIDEARYLVIVQIVCNRRE